MEAKSEVIERLEAKANRAFPHVLAARDLSARTLEKLRELLRGHDPEDASIVVFGSFARGEYTPGSDIDWTLLVDGRADRVHFEEAVAITRILDAAKFQPPSPFGVFDNVSFSHPLLHLIGGHDDTNRNTTQRILLLLESIAIGQREALDRVVDLVLHRYVSDDRGLLFSKRSKLVPRVLLNDIIRYWRTITVDFVNKQGFKGGWALRNIKLRMSRKLLFASGMLACFSLELFGKGEFRRGEGGLDPTRVVRYLRERLRLSPFEQMCEVLLRPAISVETAQKVMSSYDAFMAILSDEDKRRHLSDLPFEAFNQDALWKEATNLTYTFQDGLDQVFFLEDEEIAGLVRQFGVF
ncbi:nucleotidyltransferase domain-containing protein [Polyangium sp. y55x31]|uniref:nucleotidyltransferase domain-containing protein n=1 Tax=Polyangium sp. y55x31 TaxID=3042688 RepID=UPI002482A9F9|nr:nucleotidyltransferase domain-containing protein [Polyangium sp. y55x31]MDI1484100.1 nucleotidyltransferase domain-containing protein [Polyangium sp. y55x31]